MRSFAANTRTNNWLQLTGTREAKNTPFLTQSFLIHVPVASNAHTESTPNVPRMVSGFTGEMRVLDIGQPKAGDTLVADAASGAVRSVVDQVAKLKCVTPHQVNSQ